jgi:hypothetical protein
MHDGSIRPISTAPATTSITEYDDKYVRAMVEGIEAEKEKEGKMKRRLLILDDCVGDVKPNSAITFLCTRYRHYNLSIIISTQAFRSIPSIIRSNAAMYFIFKTHNGKELDKMDDEFGASIPRFRAIYDEATREKHSFLFLDLRDMRAWTRFFAKLLYDQSHGPQAADHSNVVQGTT